MYSKIERVQFGTGKQLKRSGNVWMDVKDFMLVSGCFEVPVFVYVDPEGRTRSQKRKKNENISTTIFVPIGDVVVSIRRESEITLPFEEVYLHSSQRQSFSVDARE